MSKALMEEVDNMQDQTGNGSREMETLRKNQKEKLEIENTVTKMKNAFTGLISRLFMYKRRIRELEDMLGETSQTKMQKGKRMGKNCMFKEGAT